MFLQYLNRFKSYKNDRIALKLILRCFIASYCVFNDESYVKIKLLLQWGLK